METSVQILSQEKREEKSKDVKLKFFLATDTFCYYRVLNGQMTYTGRIESKPSLTEGCTCHDQFHRNDRFYQDEHGFALQCKHMIQAKKLRGWH